VTQIVARSGTAADTMDVLVRSSTPPATLASNELVFARTNLFAIRGDGTGLVQLTSGGQQSEPSVAADGRIVYVETNPSDIYSRELRMREVDGRVRRLVIPPLVTWAPPRCPTWSPDMRYIAYLEVAPYYDSGVLRVIRSDSTSVLVASAGQGPEVTCPRWSPDGTRLSFAEVPDVYEGPLWGASRPVVWPLGASTAGFLAGGSLLPGAWSPAGDALATIEGDGESFWIGRLPLDGSAPTRLWLVSEVIAAGNPARSVPAWSPDGSLIAYSVTRGQVWLTDAGSSGPSWWGAMLVEGRDPAFVPAGVRFTR
jgi:Tol biopolymer transport system component